MHDIVLNKRYLQKRLDSRGEQAKAKGEGHLYHQYDKRSRRRKDLDS